MKAGWFAFIDSIKFDVPRDKGVIWAGLRDAKSVALNGDPKAKLLSDTLDRYQFNDLYKRDFGDSQTADTYRIWERVSMRYVASLKGRVTAFVEGTKFRAGSLGEFTVPKVKGLGLDSEYAEGTLDYKYDPARGAGSDVEASGGKRVPSIIITEIEELIDSNRNITAVVIKDARTGKELGTYTPGSQSKMVNRQTGMH